MKVFRVFEAQEGGMEDVACDERMRLVDGRDAGTSWCISADSFAVAVALEWMGKAGIGDELRYGNGVIIRVKDR